MIRTYTIVRQIGVQATVEECWRYLIDPALVREWFADVTGTLSSGETFEFHFGDGDFFRGSVEAADAPVGLRLEWRFMGVGLPSAIEYSLIPLKNGTTQVSVIDRSRHTEAGVIEMCEGWDDFLMRLERRIRTGENSRYRWTESIGCGAVMHAAIDLRDPAVWEGFGAVVTVEETSTGLTATFADVPVTSATLRFRSSGEGAYLSVVHSGFDKLPEAIQFAERKRYAGFWAAFLARLEAVSPEDLCQRTYVHTEGS